MALRTKLASLVHHRANDARDNDLKNCEGGPLADSLIEAGNEASVVLTEQGLLSSKSLLAAARVDPALEEILELRDGLLEDVDEEARAEAARTQLPSRGEWHVRRVLIQAGAEVRIDGLTPEQYLARHGGIDGVLRPGPSLKAATLPAPPGSSPRLHEEGEESEDNPRHRYAELIALAR